MRLASAESVTPSGHFAVDVAAGGRVGGPFDRVLA